MKNKSPFVTIALNAAIILAILLSVSSLIGGNFVVLPIWAFLLVILGLIVGVLYELKEVSTLLLITITLVIVGSSSLTIIPYLGPLFKNIIGYFVYFLGSASLLLALRKAYSILK
nr:hypothetical protein [Nanoarchaeum sp.]